MEVALETRALLTGIGDFLTVADGSLVQLCGFGCSDMRDPFITQNCKHVLTFGCYSDPH